MYTHLSIPSPISWGAPEAAAHTLESEPGQCCKYLHPPPKRSRFRPLHETADDYFRPIGSRHSGANVAGAEGLLCLGIAAGASLETMLVTPLALIALTT